MRWIVELRVGSHLYGTATAGSDIDLKAVFLPSVSDILLQRARPTVTQARSRDERERNRPGDMTTRATACSASWS